MKLTRVVFIFAAMLSVFLSSCNKFVEIGPPTTQIVTVDVFKSNAAATAATTSIYTQMVNNLESSNMAVDLGLLSDELTNYDNTNVANIEYYSNAMTSDQGLGPWINAYKYIYQANAIIGQIPQNSALSKTVANQLLGEAKFIRAFWLFYLTNLYGDVPLVTTIDYTINATIARTVRPLVYQQIISDLTDAQSLLNTNFIDNSDTVATKLDRTRPNKGAATALLARVYLYENKYDSAEMEATSVIGDGTVVGVPNTNNGLYSLVPSLDSVFLVNSKEAIWQLGIPQPNNYNTPDGNVFIMLSAPGPGSNCCGIAPQLLNSFESGDSRKLNWVDSFTTTTTPQVTYYYPFKYKVQSGTTVLEDVMVLRLAEQYLIRSEARARQSNLSGAISDINVVRTRAGLAPLVVGVNTNNSSILSQILHEKQVELFTEWGQRWLDLIRTNTADSVMSIVTPSKGGAWSNDGHQLLFPISLSEIAIDVNLTQNLGY